MIQMKTHEIIRRLENLRMRVMTKKGSDRLRPLHLSMIQSWMTGFSNDDRQVLERTGKIMQYANTIWEEYR